MCCLDVGFHFSFFLYRFNWYHHDRPQFCYCPSPCVFLYVNWWFSAFCNYFPYTVECLYGEIMKISWYVQHVFCMLSLISSLFKTINFKILHIWPICTKPVVSCKIQFQDIEQNLDERDLFSWYINTYYNFNIFILYQKHKSLKKHLRVISGWFHASYELEYNTFGAFLSQTSSTQACWFLSINSIRIEIEW